MNAVDAAIPKLLDLYRACPSMPSGGRRCPACPHMTYLEFTVLFNNLQKNLQPEDIRQLIAAEPRSLDPVHLACPLLYKGICCANGGEALFCRLGEDLSLCGNLSQARVAEIIEQVGALAAPCHENLTEPYYLNLLNIPCWFAVMFDENITQPLFVQLRQELAARFDTQRYAGGYRDVTKLKEKLDLIDLFFKLNGEQRAADARECMIKIRDGFPFTGAYYLPQAEAYVQFMDELLKVMENKKNRLG